MAGDVGLNGQIQTVAAVGQIGLGGAHTDAVRVIHWDWPDSARLRVVHVWVVRMALRAEPRVECVLGW